jgi:DNA ligase (NAD+)
MDKVKTLKNIKTSNKKTKKRHIKTPIVFEIMDDIKTESKIYNEQFIDLMEQLSNIMLKQGEQFRARAYQKAQETIMSFPNDITSTNQLKGLPNIGSTIMDKLNEYVETGTLRVLEREKTNPINFLTEIYGIGPKKAKELVDAGIKNMDDLKERQNELLNDIQRVGLHYHDQIMQRIPRSEIEEYEQLFIQFFSKISSSTSDKFEIVGSYRRGAITSGDIDIIITGNNNSIYKDFIDYLINSGIILKLLSRGASKTLVMARLPGERVARRLDFLYSPPDEFAFALLYFTGSKFFNTVMRQHALKLGYTFNEHGIYKLVNNKKDEKVEKSFTCEKDIFDFLNLVYKTPVERKDGRDILTTDKDNEFKSEKDVKPKNKTVKKKIITPGKELVESPEEIIAIIQDFKHNGISVLEKLNEHELNEVIKYANTSYYNEIEVMSDNQFDIIKDFIQNNFPNNITICEIGAEVERNKMKLPYEMASMDKIKPDTNALTNWIQKFKGPYLLSCKLDGVSGLYTFEGKEPKLYTRGNGKVGQDISHLIPYLKLPKTKNVVIRGEFIIPKSVFADKYKIKFANPRNMVAGLINHKTINEAIVDLHFVAYEVIKPEKKPSEQMEFLSTLNVETVMYMSSDKITNEMLSQLLVEWRQDYMYEIDGIIVTDDQKHSRKSGNPEHSFAFKMVLSDQIAEAKVIDVIWTPSKDGYLKPRVRIEAIHLGGVKIEYATGFNGAFIKDNNIGIGAVIEIIRSGDVIPHIKSVTTPAPEPKMPDVPYKWNDTHVDVMLEDITNDSTVKEKNITGFFRGIGVDGLSSGNISRIIGSGYDTVTKIIQMNKDDLLKVEGFKDRMADKIYTGIQIKLKEASLETLMSATNIFGRGFSDKKITLIMDELPDILVSNLSDTEKVQYVSKIKGMALKTAEIFVSNINEFKQFLKDSGLEYKLNAPIKEKNIDIAHPLYNKTVVLTGTRDKQIIDYLKAVGAIQGTNVSSNTFLVIAKTVEEDTGKAEDARKLNIPIMSVQNFISSYIKK